MKHRTSGFKRERATEQKRNTHIGYITPLFFSVSRTKVNDQKCFPLNPVLCNALCVSRWIMEIRNDQNNDSTNIIRNWIRVRFYLTIYEVDVPLQDSCLTNDQYNEGHFNQAVESLFKWHMNVQYGLGISFIPTDGLETRTLFLSCRLLKFCFIVLQLSMRLHSAHMWIFLKTSYRFSVADQ